jgi:hypothetical protein
VKPFAQPGYAGKPATAVSSSDMSLQAPPPPPWEGRAIATHKLRLVEFSAFMEQQRDADTVRVECFSLPLFINLLRCLNCEFVNALCMQCILIIKGKSCSSTCFICKSTEHTEYKLLFVSGVCTKSFSRI